METKVRPRDRIRGAELKAIPMSYNRHCMAISNTGIVMQLSASQGIWNAFNVTTQTELLQHFNNPVTNWPVRCFLHSVSNVVNSHSESTKKENMRERSQRKNGFSLVRENGLELMKEMDLCLKDGFRQTYIKPFSIDWSVP